MRQPTSSERANRSPGGAVRPVSVIVPLDGSTASARSLVPGAAIARTFGAELHLVSVVMPSFVSTVTDRLRGQAAQAGISEPAITLDISSMAPADRLLATLDDDPAALLCMATTGRSRFGQVLGSVAEALLRARSGPFVLIGPACIPDVFGGGGPIVVPIDGSDTADSVLPLVDLWAAATELTAQFVTVVAGPDESAPTTAKANDPDDTTAMLRRRSEQVEGASTKVLHHARAATAIVEHAHEVDASLIAMATHGRTGLPRVVLGSVAMEIARRAPCPVLVHRPLHLRAG